MTPTLWIYTRDGAAGRPAGRVELADGRATLHDATDPGLAAVLDELAAMPALPLATEAWEGEGAARQLVLRRVPVRPTEPAYPHALAQALERLAPVVATTRAPGS